MSKSFNKLIQSILCFSMLTLAITANAQTTQSVEAPANQLNEYNSLFPLEKVYLHTDRKHYAAGEQVWFQAYVVAGFFHEPSPLSNNLYVSLHREDKTIVESQMIRVDVGGGHGVIDLPDSLAEGSYILRANTNWMNNFGEAYFYEKELIVVGVTSNLGLAAQTKDVDLQFFPEGGHLVDQVASRIGFKAINEQGKAMDVTGIIYDQDNNEVTRFESQHEGMGMLVITPQKGKKYRAEVDGRTYLLPEVEKEGFSLSANSNIKDILRLTIRSNEATANKEQMGLLVHARGAVSFAFDVDISKNIAFLNLPKADLPAGINHITLFDNQGNALVERLVFIEPKNETVSLTTDRSTYGKREKVTATLKVTDADGKPVGGFFSLAAIDLGQSADQAPEETILSNLLLSSDLKGHIANPMYYFDTANPAAKKHLDLVMMTHGWTRFTWKTLPEKIQAKAKFPVEQGLNIPGRLLRLNSKRAAQGGEISLVNQNSMPPLIRNVKAADNGDFVFENVLIFDDEEVVFQGVNKNGKPMVDLEVNLPQIFPVLYQFNTPLQKNDSETIDAALFNEKKKYRDQIEAAYGFDSTATDLGTVVVEGNREKVVTEDAQRKSVYGRGDDTFTVDEDDVVVSTNAMEMISGKLAGVQVTGFGQSMSVVIRGAATGSGSALPPLILLNDVPTDIAGILMVPAQVIQRVEVFKGPRAAIFGVRGGGGVLAFYTKDGTSLASAIPAKGVLTTTLKDSYRKPRAFYAPKYDVQKPEHIKPDSRIVLAWKPLILLDENGTAQVEFWNSDEATDVLIDLQGLTMTGTPLATTIQYKTGKRN